MKRERGAGVSIALIAGVLIVWFAQTARFKRSMRKGIFNVVLRGDRSDELFEREEMQRVRCLCDVNAT